MRPYYYLFTLSYVGARFFGWQKQKDFPSIHDAFNTALEKALFDTFGKTVEYKSLGASRTDARVNAFGQRVKVKLVGHEIDPIEFKKVINELIPFDIHIIEIQPTVKQLAVIAHTKEKDYFYFFTDNSERSPFLFPYITYFNEPNLNRELMKEGAKLFIGTHYFKNYSYRPSNSIFERTIYRCELNFEQSFSKEGLNITSHQLYISGDGFLKQMVRIIMGTLIDLGRGNCTLKDIEESLQEGSTKRLGFISPPQGLFLNKVKYIDKFDIHN